MQLIKGTTDIHTDGPSVVTLGKFDGIHRGHQELIRRAYEISKGGYTATAFIFDISPTRLLTRHERRPILEKLGITCQVECPFVPEIITMAPEDFVRKVLVDGLHAKYLVVGPNFRFGYEREGTVDTLKTLGTKYGFRTEVVPAVTDGGEAISSTRIRECLGRGDMAKVNRMLGYPFFVTGQIVHGRMVGRTLGVPTTNIIPSRAKLLPPNGVYASETMVGDKVFPGMTDIGTKPTVDGQFTGVETYLFDCDEDLYGVNEEVRLLCFERPEVKFPSIEDLKKQLAEDEKISRAFFENHQPDHRDHQPAPFSLDF